MRPRSGHYISVHRIPDKHIQFTNKSSIRTLPSAQIVRIIYYLNLLFIHSVIRIWWKEEEEGEGFRHHVCFRTFNFILIRSLKLNKITQSYIQWSKHVSHIFVILNGASVDFPQATLVMSAEPQSITGTATNSPIRNAQSTIHRTMYITTANFSSVYWWTHADVTTQVVMSWKPKLPIHSGE